MRLWKKAQVGLLLATSTSLCLAGGQHANLNVQPNNGDLTVTPVTEIDGSTFNGQLAGHSKPAIAAEWPASYYGMTGYLVCSATLIGPRTIITAAHCVGDNKRITIYSKTDAPLTGICHQNDAYRKGDSSAEYALCLMDSRVQVPRYESVLIDPSQLKVHQQLLATGYGCTVTGGAPKTNQMAIGPMWVAQLAGYDTSSPNLMATGYNPDSAFLCEGDSGGATYIGTEGGARVVAAINAAVDSPAKISYLAPLSTPIAVSFLKKWAATSGQEICGVSAGLAQCVTSPQP